MNKYASKSHLVKAKCSHILPFIQLTALIAAAVTIFTFIDIRTSSSFVGRVESWPAVTLVVTHGILTDLKT